MPYLKPHLWPQIFSYLPEKEHGKATIIAKHIEENHRLKQRQRLRAQEEKSPTQIYFPNIVVKPKDRFVFIIRQQASNIDYKFHISILPEDYPLVLKSQLNQILQQYLVSSPDKKTLTHFKYANSNVLKNEKRGTEFVMEQMKYFYQLMAQYHCVRKPNLYAEIIRLHHYLIEQIGEFTPLVSLFKEPQNLNDYRKNDFAFIKSIYDSIVRFEQQVQYSLYLCSGASIDNLAALIKHISDYLDEQGIRSVPCPDSDLPLTQFVTFRQEREYGGGRYIEVADVNSAKLKEYARSSIIYKELVSNLTHLNQGCNANHTLGLS